MCVVQRFETVIAHLEYDGLEITEWFPNYSMKLNENKCQLIVFGARGGNETTIKIGDTCMKESSEENLLGNTFDQSLSFNEHVKTRERRRRGRGNGHSINFRCVMQNSKTRLRLMATCKGHKVLGREKC